MLAVNSVCIFFCQGSRREREERKEQREKRLGPRGEGRERREGSLLVNTIGPSPVPFGPSMPSLIHIFPVV